MDKITKFLQRLTPKERDRITAVVVNIVAGKTAGFDCKKMKGHANLYRVRVGDVRIVYLELNGERRVVLIDRHNDNTYRAF